MLTGLAALTLAVTAALPTGALAQNASPVTGGTLIVAADGTAFPPNLNPAIATSNGVTYISSKVVEYLADAGYDGLQPRLATSWEGSDDGLTFTVHLRDGVKFSDGVPMTSADVKFSAEEAWKPLQNFGRVVLANLDTVETPDPLTAVFKFSKPTPPSLIANALPILSAVLPAHVYQGTDFATALQDSPLNQQPVGTGPFVFSEVKPGELIRLTKNPNYWGEGEPYLDEIVFQVLPDAAARAAALESGAVQATVFAGVPGSTSHAWMPSMASRPRPRATSSSTTRSRSTSIIAGRSSPTWRSARRSARRSTPSSSSTTSSWTRARPSPRVPIPPRQGLLHR